MGKNEEKFLNVFRGFEEEIGKTDTIYTREAIFVWRFHIRKPCKLWISDVTVEILNHEFRFKQKGTNPHRA